MLIIGKKRRKICHTAIALIVAQGVSAQTYIVQKNDYLSKILNQKKLYPLYGPDGTISQTIALNDFLKVSKGDLIYPGQEIILPIKTPITEVPRSKPTEETPQENQPKRNSTASASAYFGLRYLQIQSQDKLNLGSLAINSNLSPSIGFSWNVHWDEKITYSIGAEALFYSYQKPNSVNRNLNRYKGQSYALYASGSYLLNEKLTLTGGIKAKEYHFYRVEQFTTINIEKEMVIAPLISLRYKIKETQNAELGTYVNFLKLLPRSADQFEIEDGHEYSLGMYLKRNSLEAQFYYSQNGQDTSLTYNKVKQLGINFIYDWELP